MLGLRRFAVMCSQASDARAHTTARPRDLSLLFVMLSSCRSAQGCADGARELRTTHLLSRYARVLAPLARRASLSLSFLSRGSLGCSPSRAERLHRARATRVRSAHRPLRGLCCVAAVPVLVRRYVAQQVASSKTPHRSSTRVPQESPPGSQFEGASSPCGGNGVSYHPWWRKIVVDRLLEK